MYKCFRISTTTLTHQSHNITQGECRTEQRLTFQLTEKYLVLPRMAHSNSLVIPETAVKLTYRQYALILFISIIFATVNESQYMYMQTGKLCCKLAMTMFP